VERKEIRAGKGENEGCPYTETISVRRLPGLNGTFCHRLTRRRGGGGRRADVKVSLLTKQREGTAALGGEASGRITSA